jgi:hypothetical protein
MLLKSGRAGALAKGPDSEEFALGSATTGLGWSLSPAMNLEILLSNASKMPPIVGLDPTFLLNQVSLKMQRDTKI